MPLEVGEKRNWVGDGIKEALIILSLKLGNEYLGIQYIFPQTL